MPIRTPTGLKLTYEDYVKIPDDGRRHEIIDGRQIVSPAPTARHQVVLRELYEALRGLRDSGRAELLWAPVAVHLTETDIVQPDLIAIARQRADLIGEVKVAGPPDLVAEVLSPSTRRIDRGIRRARYESAGVQEYWLVDPDGKTLCQLVLVNGRYEETVHTSGEVVSAAFPEVTVDLGTIFG